MTDFPDTMRGSGNVFADLRDTDVEAKGLNAKLAADIIATLNVRKLSVREAGAEHTIRP